MTAAPLSTPCLLLDESRFQANIARMAAQMRKHGVALRPHMKTAKALQVARAVTRMEGSPVPPGSVTVSTLQEAEVFAGAGYSDVLYAVGISEDKFARAAKLNSYRADSGSVTVILDSLDVARSLVDFTAREDVRIPCAIEIDSDDQRGGLRPDDPQVVEIGELLERAGLLRGVMTHAGGSYQARSLDDIRAVARREREAVVSVAAELRRRGAACAMVSVGSTPTALFGESFEGVSEVRAGVYMFMDLVMASLGVCAVENIALSVLTTVIGHQPARNRLIVDAGWTALRATPASPVCSRVTAGCATATVWFSMIYVSSRRTRNMAWSARCPNARSISHSFRSAAGCA